MKKLPFFLISLLFLASCTEDDPKTEDLTSEEASDAIHETASDMSDDILTLVESDGVESVSTLLDFLFESSEFGDIGIRKDESKARILEIGRLFGSLPAARVSNADYPIGVFEWNHLEGDFIFVDESENLVLKFPVGESETNNGIFTLSELTFLDNGLPTDIAAMVTVDETLMVDIDFRVNWSSDDFPETADIYIFVNPFTFDFNFNDSEAESSSLMASIAIGGEVIASIDLVAHYETTLKVFPSDIEGSIAYRSMKIAGGIDLLDGLENEEGNPNEFVDLSLYVDDERVGDIVFELETDGFEEYYVAYVVYLDGTAESLEDFIDSIAEEVEMALDGI